MDKLTTDFKEYLHERLQDPEAAAEYLNAAMEGHDACSFLLALRLVAEARGISQVAQDADLNRESLYKMLSDQGNPRLSSMLAVFEAIGVQIQVKPLRRDISATRGTVIPTLAGPDEIQEEAIMAQLSNAAQESEYGSAHTSDFKSAAA
jgi:probable addiction module antidote protein